MVFVFIDLESYFQVLLEFVGVRNLPDGHKGSLFVSFTKSQPDIFFDSKRKLTILSESKEKQVAMFQCEPTGELLFELISHSPSNLPLTRTSKTLGTSSLSLKDLLAPVSKLSMERWLDLVPCSGNVNSKPIGLRVAVSLTVPAPAQRTLDMVHSRPVSKSSCFFPLPGKIKDPNSRMHVIDESGTKLISLQIRYPFLCFPASKLTLPDFYLFVSLHFPCLIICISYIYLIKNVKVSLLSKKIYEKNVKISQ